MTRGKIAGTVLVKPFNIDGLFTATPWCSAFAISECVRRLGSVSDARSANARVCASEGFA